MKKILYLLFAFSLTINFIGCSKDDDSDNSKDYYNPYIYGNWDTSPTSSSKFPFYCTDYSVISENEYFETNTVLIHQIKWSDKYSTENIPSEMITGTFKIDNNRIIINTQIKGDFPHKETIVLGIEELSEKRLIIKENGISIIYNKSEY